MEAGRQGGLPDVSSMISAIANNEKLVVEENSRLKQIYAIQEALMEKQRKALKEVAQTSAELLEVEKKRAELKEKLASQKTQLLTSSAEAQEVSSIIEEILNNSPQPTPIAETNSGNIALKIVETVAKHVSELTDACIKDKTLCAPASNLQDIIMVTSQLIQKVADADLIKESSQDVINRQSYVISSLVQASQEQE